MKVLMRYLSIVPDTYRCERDNNSHAQQRLEVSATDGRYSSKVRTSPFPAITYYIDVCADPNGRDLRVPSHVLCLVTILRNAILDTCNDCVRAEPTNSLTRMIWFSPESTQMELAKKWIDRICAFEDETFDIALPVLVHPFTNEVTRLSALNLFPKLGQRLGTQRTKTCLLKPIIALFEVTGPLDARHLKDCERSVVFSVLMFESGSAPL